MRVDLHAHVLPDVIPAPADSSDADRWPHMDVPDAEGMRLLTAGNLRFRAQRAFCEPEGRLTAMDANGVDAEVLSPMPPLLDYGLTPHGGRELGRCVNEFIARLCAADPQRFFGLGTVPLQDPELAAEELSHVRELGLHGIEIGSNVGGQSLGDERFLGFFQEAARLELPVFVHAYPTPGTRLPANAAGTFGVGSEIALTAASIIASGTAERCPSLRLAFSHGAGGFPLTLPRAQYFWGGTWNEEPPTAGSGGGSDGSTPSPIESARRFYYDALVFDRRALRYLIDMLGPTRLVLGTDFPAMPREQPVDRTLRSMELPADTHEDITWNNAFRFLGIAPPRPASRRVTAAGDAQHR